MATLFIVVSALGAPLQRPDAATIESAVRNALRPFESHATVGTLDNRVGFAFASLEIGEEDGEDSTIGMNQHRIAACAKLLKSYPSLYLQLEGHTGITAPSSIAQSFSEQRASVIASALVEGYGIAPERLRTRGWGSRIARLAQGSVHPNALSANVLAIDRTVDRTPLLTPALKALAPLSRAGRLRLGRVLLRRPVPLWLL